MDNEINKFISQSLSILPEPLRRPIDGIPQCMVKKHIILSAVAALIANTTSCVNSKIEEAHSYVADIYNRSKLAIDNVVVLKEEGDTCMRQIKNVSEIIQATGCLVQTSTKGAVVVVQTIPPVIADFGKLIFEISTLQSAVPACISSKATWTIAQEATNAVVSIKDCVKKHIDELMENENEVNTTQEELDKLNAMHLEFQKKLQADQKASNEVSNHLFYP